MKYQKTELGQQALKNRSIPLSPRQRSACAAIRIGNMYRTIGPTNPGFGSPASSTPNPPITAIGNGPFSM